MVQRDITGDVARRSKYAEAKAIADEKGLTDGELNALADGVREFDQVQSQDEREVRALEDIAESLRAIDPNAGADSHAWRARQLLERRTRALELLAVGPIATEEDLTKIINGQTYKSIVRRLAQSFIGD